VETKIASFIEQVLTGELSSDMLKETGEKYPPPDNCQHLTTVMVNGEIWDLLSRKSRTVDLGFQKVQGPFMQGLSTLTILADRLLKDVKNSKNTNIRDVLQQLMDGIVLLGNANWNLIMKRREFIKSDLNPPYTRLCKEDIKPTTKLFGDDLSKHLKEMSEAKRAGQQMQKTVSSAKVMKNRGYRFKPYDKPITSFGQTWQPGNKSYNYRRPFLGHSRATSQATMGPRRQNNHNNKSQ
jgi:hypothetical protein